MATVRENLIAAKALIDTPDKWAKGPMEFPRMCAIRAVEKACGIPYHEGNYCPEGRVLQSVLDEALERTDEWFAIHPRPLWTVGGYNDHRLTTHDDIMSLFDRAIEASE